MFIIYWIAAPMARNDNGDKKNPPVGDFFMGTGPIGSTHFERRC